MIKSIKLYDDIFWDEIFSHKIVDNKLHILALMYNISINDDCVWYLIVDLNTLNIIDYKLFKKCYYGAFINENYYIVEKNSTVRKYDICSSKISREIIEKIDYSNIEIYDIFIFEHKREVFFVIHDSNKMYIINKNSKKEFDYKNINKIIHIKTDNYLFILSDIKFCYDLNTQSVCDKYSFDDKPKSKIGNTYVIELSNNDGHVYKIYDYNTMNELNYIIDTFYNDKNYYIKSYYIINNEMYINENILYIKEKFEDYYRENINDKLLELYKSKNIKQFNIILNNYLDILDLKEYNEFISNINQELYLPILEYMSIRIIK